MKKVYVANPENKLEQYRFVINVNEYYSVGVELSLEEVRQLSFELKDILENAEKRSNITVRKEKDE